MWDADQGNGTALSVVHERQLVAFSLVHAHNPVAERPDGYACPQRQGHGAALRICTAQGGSGDLPDLII